MLGIQFKKKQAGVIKPQLAKWHTSKLHMHNPMTMSKLTTYNQDTKYQRYTSPHYPLSTTATYITYGISDIIRVSEIFPFEDDRKIRDRETKDGQRK